MSGSSAGATTTFAAASTRHPTLRAFFAQDYSAWEVILRETQVDGCEAMLRDCASDPSYKMLSRDFSGLRDLCDELNIRDKVDYEFQ